MNAIYQFLREHDYELPDEEYYDKIREFQDWYEDGADDFHKLRWFNGIQEVSREMSRLSMAKTVAEDWANLLLNEKVEINTEDEQAQKDLDEILKRNKFKVNANRLVEKAFALGTGAFIEYLQDNEVSIDYVTAQHIFPLKWDSKGIHECAFGSEHMEGDDVIYYLQVHTRNRNKNYEIENFRFKAEKDSDAYTEVPLPEGMTRKWNTNSRTPYFQIVMPNIVNNADMRNPLGISIYGNAIDILKQIDMAYDSLGNEVPLSRKMVFLRTDMFGIDTETGEMYSAIDKGDTVFHYLSSNPNDNTPIIHEYSSSMRISEFREIIQENLNLLSKKCGMGTNFYEFNDHGLQTATAVISDNADLFDSINKHELLLNDAVVGMAEACLELSGHANAEVTVNFDDSIMQDTDAIKAQAMVEYNAGLIDAVVYFMRVNSMTEEQAIKYVEAIRARNPQPEPMPDLGA